MSQKYYSQKTASFRATTIDSRQIDTSQIFISPQKGGSTEERKDILDIIQDSSINVEDGRTQPSSNQDIWRHALVEEGTSSSLPDFLSETLNNDDINELENFFTFLLNWESETNSEEAESTSLKKSVKNLFVPNCGGWFNTIIRGGNLNFEAETKGYFVSMISMFSDQQATQVLGGEMGFTNEEAIKIRDNCSAILNSSGNEAGLQPSDISKLQNTAAMLIVEENKTYIADVIEITEDNNVTLGEKRFVLNTDFSEIESGFKDNSGIYSLSIDEGLVALLMSCKVHTFAGDLSKLKNGSKAFYGSCLFNFKVSNLDSLEDACQMFIYTCFSPNLTWNIKLPKLKYARQMFALAGAPDRWCVDLPNLIYGYGMFNSGDSLTSMKKFRGSLQSLKVADEMFSYCNLDLESLIYIFDTIPTITEEEKTNGILIQCAEYDQLFTPGNISIGLAGKPENYETYDDWFLSELGMTVQDVLDEFSAKNWTVKLFSGAGPYSQGQQVGSNARSRGISEDKFYVSIREVDGFEKMIANYISLDETKYYRVEKFGVTNKPEDFLQFSSEEEMCNHFGIKIKENNYREMIKNGDFAKNIDLFQKLFIK